MERLPDFQSLLALQWRDFLNRAKLGVYSLPARVVLERLESPEAWASTPSEAEILQSETAEAYALLDRHGLWQGLKDLEDPSGILDVLEKQGVLSLRQLVCLQSWLVTLDAWVQCPREDIPGKQVRFELDRLAEPRDVLRILSRVLSPEGDILDSASPRLSKISAELRAIRTEIAATMDRVLKRYERDGILQESYFDVRDGRYVLPIKVSQQSECDGIVFDYSSTKQTVFIEPREIETLNNRLRQKENDRAEEIFKILREVSDSLRENSGDFEAAFVFLVRWDSIQARARLGLSVSGRRIEVVDEECFEMSAMAHPLLWGGIKPEDIVRNNIVFENPQRLMLITGPNAGGKTVLLKAVGMAAIFARTGFFMPGMGRIKVPFFDQVFADIGDPQSIEGHVSSFSGKLLRLKGILDSVGRAQSQERPGWRALILLDEMNAATDPDEGAALARSVLEYLLETSPTSMMIATTHDPRLKSFAVTDPRVASASMQFDEVNLLPTFRVINGVPGRSRALELAERIGISKAVLTRARDYLSGDHQQFESLLARLEEKLTQAQSSATEAQHLQKQAEKLEAEWRIKIEMTFGETVERTRRRLKTLLTEVSDKAQNVLSRLERDVQAKSGMSRKSRDRLAEDLKHELSTLVEGASDKIAQSIREESPESAEILEPAGVFSGLEVGEASSAVWELGARVRIPKWKTQGVLAEILENSVGVIMESKGGASMRMTLSKSDVEIIEGPNNGVQNAKATRVQINAEMPSGGVLSSLDLRGVRLDEAERKLEAYLDQALRSGHPQVTIIHGLATGVLREATRRILKNLPYIKAYRDGGPGAGGAGATVVEFDRN